ncbi:MAG TPA: MBOAT family O-acyltransferase [Candidatus Elarobacter sp.]|jgi:alginate O-acetyltransferase complex protein AlgI
MIFNTWTFGIFALLTLTLYWSAVPQRLKPYYLVVAGTVFYAFSVPAYLVLIAALGLVTYGVAIAMLRERRPHARRAWMAVGVTLITGVLVVFKYSGFFARTVDQIAGHDIVPLPHIVVPLAISFFTFEFVHVLVDVYLGKITEVDATDFAVFTMFFPTLVAGPIKRFQTFAPQVRHITLPADGELGLHLYRVVAGLAKKFIIADSMTLLTQPMLDPTGASYGRVEYIVAVFAYTAKIYFDFTGYSDIAIGVAGLLGVAIPENFDRPYWAPNISAFWRRWHMSLSSWIRDYIFIPLGGSRRPPLITALNLFLAMAIAGLWHGAAWTFVAWGLWHGIGLAVHRLWSVRVVPAVAFLARPSRAITALSVATTFAFVVAGWVLFAAPTFDAAAQTVARAAGGAVPDAR